MTLLVFQCGTKAPPRLGPRRKLGLWSCSEGAAAAAYELSGGGTEGAGAEDAYKVLASLTRFRHLWCTKDGVVIPPEGPSWEQARRPSRVWA